MGALKIRYAGAVFGSGKGSLQKVPHSLQGKERPSTKRKEGYQMHESGRCFGKCECDGRKHRTDKEWHTAVRDDAAVVSESWPIVGCCRTCRRRIAATLGLKLHLGQVYGGVGQGW